MTKGYVSLPDGAEAGLRGFLQAVDEHLSEAADSDAMADAVAEILVDLHGERDAWERWQAGESVSRVERGRLQSLHPRNVTLESEYYAEKDEDAYARSKPLQYLWRRFDASPLADNVGFALRFRRLLAEHLFADVGENVRLFRGISMTYGHNLSIGDNVVVHDDVHLDDRGRLQIGDRVSISDGAHLYSHDHDIVDQTEVTNYLTIIEDDVRVTQGAMVRAGVRVGEDAIVGARAVVQGDVPEHHVVVGMPARSIGTKPGFEEEAPSVDDTLPDRRDEREIPYELPDDFEAFDEFERPERYDDPVEPHSRS
jgi:acetyltransferase-like isoleucine patch superfamily enzyme